MPESSQSEGDRQENKKNKKTITLIGRRRNCFLDEKI